jgi:glycosyltransferase involved in cell wall biosynthesis
VKIFDYLACGKPVVAADVGKTSSFFAPSGAVMTVEPEIPDSLADAIVQLLADQDLRRKMGVSGREFILGRFSRTRIAEIVEKISLNLVRSQKN